MGQTQTQELCQLANDLEISIENEDGISEKHIKLCYKIILAMRSAAPNVKNVRGERQVLKEYGIEEVLPFLPVLGGKKEKDYKVGNDTFKVKMYSDRYKMFLDNLSCVRCGIVGSIFKLERMTDGIIERAHFNLYAINPVTGIDILMTKDHILPRSMGGKDKFINYQTMCTFCNNDKGNNPEEKYIIHIPKYTDWISPNSKWLVTVDKVTAYDKKDTDTIKYCGRVIDIVTGRTVGWTKMTDGSNKINGKLPTYIRSQISSINI
jgi:5-methylcytosine-specific restriction endonuclease McrA